MPSTRQSDDYQFGIINTKVEKLESEIMEIKRDVREIRDTLTGVRGSWKALLAVGSILSGVLVTIGIKIFDIFTGK